MILDGKEVSRKVKLNLKEKVTKLVEKYHVKPQMAIVLIGHNEASEVYVHSKIKSAHFVGIEPLLIRKDESITHKELLSLIDELNNDDKVHGIIVQLPLPKHLDEKEVIDRISCNKDIDGFGLLNKGKLFSDLPCLAPATPLGITHLLDAYNIDIKGKDAVVVGASNIVGKPMAIMLLHRNATVTIAHIYTQNLKEITRKADVLVVAIGKAKFFTADMIKPGAIVIDVGINRIDGKLYGDVDFENVEKIASYITPVPGGVGPLTVSALLYNTVLAYEQLMKEEK